MRIKAIKLDFEIPSHVVKADRLNVDISNLDESLFMRIASGRITISVDAVKEPIVLETEVLDYSAFAVLCRRINQEPKHLW